MASEPTIAFEALGADLPQPCVVPLRAGPVTLRFVDGDLRDLHAGGEELVRRITFNVRHHRWDTADNTIERLRLTQTPDTFQLHYVGRCTVDGAIYTWTADLAGGADGTITYRVAGSALAPITEIRRAGLNVLFHLDAVNGLSFDVADKNGASTSLTFPGVVGPHHLLAMDFQALSFHTRGGAQVRTEVSGSHFGLEDQRVAGDNSFKAFSGLRHQYAPLAANDVQEETVKITVSDVAALVPPALPTAFIGLTLPHARIPVILPAKPSETYGVFHDLTRRPAAKNGIFLDLNVAPERSHGAKSLTWGWYPNINLYDDETLMENASAIYGQAGAARKFAPDAAIRIDPISLDSIHPRTVPRDPRNDTLFAAAWSLAALKHLALSPIKEAAFALDGAAARAVQQAVAVHSGCPTRAVKLQATGLAPLEVLAADTATGLVAFAANLTSETVRYVLAGLPAEKPARLHRLNDSRLAAFREVPGVFTDGDGRITLTLAPHEVAFLAFAP